MAVKTKEDLLAELEEHRSRVQEIDTKYAGEFIAPDTDDGREWADRNAKIDEISRTLDQLRRREERIAEIAGDPSRTEEPPVHVPRAGVARGEDIYDLSTVRASVSNPSEQARELRERALRAVEASRPRHPEIDRDAARSRVEELVREHDSEDGRFARYLLATGSPVYKRAFGKYLASQQRSREEQAAMEFAQHAERALSLTASAGGFAVPFELDPTILGTSNGVINPIRQIARVEQITVDEWRGVTSSGITASYGAEATEATDNSPTLGQPTVSTEKAQAFVPFSIEIGQDWNGLQAQMARLLQEARDELEAAKFVNGTGTNEPFGVLTGTTTTVNAAAGADAFTLANLYSLAAALPARYRPNGRFLADLLILQRIRQFDTVGSPSNVWADSLTVGEPGMLLGKPAYEASEMPNDATTGNKFLLFGDFSRYLIVDRVGLTIEVIPHLMGANQRPTGQRGIYAYWRNGAKVIDANAFRALIGTI